MKAYLELVRAPAALTVLGDTLVGAASAGRALGVRGLALPLASACLYASGMALNDYADRELDAVERPERPIPSGRISPRRALGVAVGLTAAGLAIAAAAGGRRSFAVALPLTASIWLYDLVAKPTAAGPAVMAACRGLDVLMGAGSDRIGAAAPSAAIMASHTFGVTALARGEVHGTTPAIARAVALGTAANTIAALSIPLPAGSVSGSPGGLRAPSPAAGATRTLAAASALSYAAACGPAQLETVETPDAAHARRATGRGIRAMVPLQTALAARAGSLGATLVLAAVDVAGRLLSRRRSTADIT
ncbi:SCO3242 family prenyltransferase [Compostimonas suwonensis]|uniref:SCO3242 family prenyltransferase n=1 Tax=Compostimonas suwonensis TaxID=1048394 RepID=UPI000C235C23|nr:UbiA family prenyltransferase [Compostimonas suwonensis]